MPKEVNKKKFNFLVALRKWKSTFTPELGDKNQPTPMNCERQISSATSLENYRLGVITLMSLKSGDIITNSEPAHAAVLFEVFFKHATEKVRILCKNLSQEVFGQPALLTAARAASAKGISLDVLIQDESPDNSEFTQWVNSEKNPNVSIRRVPSWLRNASTNFAVMDTTAYRYEPDRTKIVATASMYNPDVAKFLAEKFDSFAAAAS